VTRVAVFTGPSSEGERVVLRQRYGIAEQGLAPGPAPGCLHAQPPLPAPARATIALDFPKFCLTPAHLPDTLPRMEVHV